MISGPGFWVTFLYYFSSTALIVTFVAVKGAEISLDSGMPYQLGVISGLVAGLLGAYFNRNIMVSIPFKRKKTLIQNLEVILDKMGYTAADSIEDFSVYRRSGFSHFFSGTIMVKVGSDEVTLSGRSTLLNMIQQQLGNLNG